MKSSQFAKVAISFAKQGHDIAITLRGAYDAMEKAGHDPYNDYCWFEEDIPCRLGLRVGKLEFGPRGSPSYSCGPIYDKSVSGARLIAALEEILAYVTAHEAREPVHYDVSRRVWVQGA